MLVGVVRVDHLYSSLTLAAVTAYTVLVKIRGQVMSAASSAAYVTGPPTVTSVSPTVGSASTPPVVTLTGTGYGSATADITRVTMGVSTGTGLTCTGVVWVSSTVIRCRPPALVVTSSYVFIVTAGGQAMSGASSVSFSTIAAPTVNRSVHVLVLVVRVCLC